MASQFFTSESVTEGHPDKICDQVSDAILDAIIMQDPYARVAVECTTTTGMIFIAGEVSTTCYVDIPTIARATLREIGYTNPEYGIDSADCAVITAIHEQSKNISVGVTGATANGNGSNAGAEREQGAGDQGMMFGYACRETETLMPLPITLAHRLAYRLAQVRKQNLLTWVRPDGKAQVTVEYEETPHTPGATGTNGVTGVNGWPSMQPKRVDTVVIAVHHDPHIEQKQIRESIIEEVIKPVCGKLLDAQTKIHVNATGIFVVGGPEADTGLTGRKIIVDTYGGYSRHGGGCFSGKDPSKVDRSGAYAARYMAKNVVAAGLADKCEVQLAYSIGVAQPVSVFVETFGTGVIRDAAGRANDSAIAALIMKHFPLKPADIIRELNLLRPIYRKTAAYGHFGREEAEFLWERTDKAHLLSEAFTR